MLSAKLSGFHGLLRVHQIVAILSSSMAAVIKDVTFKRSAWVYGSVSDRCCQWPLATRGASAASVHSSKRTLLISNARFSTSRK